MPDILTTLAGNLLVPPILFFLLGLVAAFARSDLSVPVGAAKFMALYLLLAIGFKGGASLSAHGGASDLVLAIGAGIGLSFAIPFIAFALLTAMTRLDRLNAAAVAAHYGSISIVTFVTATSLLDLSGIAHDGYMVAVAAAMEVPAIISALWLARGAGAAPAGSASLARDLLANGSIVLLTGSFAIGAVTGGRGMEAIAPFIVTPFTGILCLFLLDMGLTAGRSLVANRHMLSPGLFAFGELFGRQRRRACRSRPRPPDAVFHAARHAALVVLVLGEAELVGQHVPDARFGGGGGFGFDFLHLLGAHERHRRVDEVAHHRFDVTTVVADFTVLGRLDLDERRPR